MRHRVRMMQVVLPLSSLTRGQPIDQKNSSGKHNHGRKHHAFRNYDFLNLTMLILDDISHFWFAYILFT